MSHPPHLLARLVLCAKVFDVCIGCVICYAEKIKNSCG